MRDMRPEFRGQRLLLRYLLDDFERSEALQRSVWGALEKATGPRVWPVSTARQAEPDGVLEPPEPEYAMTLEEIAQELGLSRTRVDQICRVALAKLYWRARKGLRRSTWDDLDNLLRSEP